MNDKKYQRGLEIFDREKAERLSPLKVSEKTCRALRNYEKKEKVVNMAKRAGNAVKNLLPF